jgi:hypothetical protein
MLLEAAHQGAYEPDAGTTGDAGGFSAPVSCHCCGAILFLPQKGSSG